MSTKFSKKKKTEVYNKTNGMCIVCNMYLTFEFIDPKSSFCIDHFIPRSKGGKHNIENLFPICQPCNSRKKDYSVDDLQRQIIELKANAIAKIEKKLEIISYMTGARNEIA